MKVSVIIPTLNEEKSLPHVIKEIPKDIVGEILIIDGHSTDKTRKVAESLGCRVLLQPKKKGFGDALRFGFKEASGDVIISMDADGSHDPKDILKLINNLKEGYDLVLGSRYMAGGRSDDDTMIRHIGNMIFTFLTNLFYRSHFSDSLYLFEAVRRDKLLSLRLESDDFALCIEILAKAHKAGFRIAEIPCIEKPRIADKSRVNAFRDGLKILYQMLKWI
jgi:glycosyltransferase involved in cell wall biosynthesis